MKKIIYALLLSALAFGMAACTEEPDNGGKQPTGKNEITLTADTSTISMTPETQGETAVTLTWNAASNMGTGARITYSILIDEKGNEFANAYELELGANVTSTSFTGLQMNKIMTEELGFEVGETANIEVCVYAMIASDSVDDVVSNAVELSVTVFEAAAEIIYMAGTATTAGWDHTIAVPMTPIVGVPGGFTWSGELGIGEMKFIASQLGWEPGWGPADDFVVGKEGKLHFREHLFEDEEETIDTWDPKFNITTEGNYKITINIQTLTYKFDLTSSVEFATMQLVGTAVGEEAIDLKRQGTSFFYSGILSAGNYHFLSGTTTFGPEEANSVPDDKTNLKVVKGSENEWTNSKDNQFYKIAFNAKSGKEYIYASAAKPYDEIYLIGDATSAGWTLDNAVPMTKQDNFTQVWEGQLKKGELKFSCDKQSDWFGTWYLAPSNGAAPTGEIEHMLFIDKNSNAINRMGLKGLDQKWKITEAGTYSITLNQRDETVIIQKK